MSRQDSKAPSPTVLGVNPLLAVLTFWGLIAAAAILLPARPPTAPEPQKLDVTIRFAPLEFTPKRVEPVVKFSIPEPTKEPL